ncbi:glycosyltransferase family 2 protein [Psychromonas sp. KJ10-2]|uniref:glycosyltransferase family 2 protein n=1 Tax=Psychromonas sp. KJ10-2 TaxID=3391822 RepID=UPI0039B383D1
MKPNSISLVSIILPTHNRGELFVKAINSVLNQTYQNIEIIIIDDFSLNPPNLKCFQTSIPIIYHRNNKNLGGAKSRNIGFDLSNGQYICFLDDDDTYISNKIEVLLNELEKDYSVGAVFGKVIKSSLPSREMKKIFEWQYN